MKNVTTIGIKVKLTITLFLLFIAPYAAVYADTVNLRSLERDIQGKVVELTQGYVGLSISKKDIKSVTFLPDDKRAYTDVITFYRDDIRLKCKVASVNTNNVVIWIPKAEIVSVNMVFAPEVAGRERPDIGAVQRTPPPTYSPPAEARAPLPGDIQRREPSIPTPTPPSDEWVESRPAEPEISREEAKEMVKSEVMQELEAESAVMGEEWQSPQVFKEEIKRELKEELEEKQKSEEKIFQETSLGRVEGKMLRKGLPLPDCEVRILMLVKSKIPFTKNFFQPDLPTEYNGITDAEGRYHLLNVAPGEYKIYWKPAAETGWIRRLEMKPDITVEAGKTTYPKDIETFKRVLN